MLSAGKQKQILCPNCGNADIDKQRMYGQMSGVCVDSGGCNTWWPWKDRLIVPLDCSDADVRRKVTEYKERLIKRRGGRFRIFLDSVADRWSTLVFNFKNRGLKCLFCRSMLTWTRR